MTLPHGADETSIMWLTELDSFILAETRQDFAWSHRQPGEGHGLDRVAPSCERIVLAPAGVGIVADQ